ncbi:hypothetical protein H310_07460 [Aphanomyces invadans]|uniref:Uncharacterized protein n=1 Tax=Aphanomyces invadans TaxID=157072 RepID=A0A024U1C9_9STRA|nr:hypothetical protein H310_07460 [Aphanomyces invadans]ETW00020.1 hypothetical protein H310_07460 [Aphanomyces invadans]|eukprot:XP_008871045.1 hypothetical protein H310_07460 [Aphanomyces invadans]
MLVFSFQLLPKDKRMLLHHPHHILRPPRSPPTFDDPLSLPVWLVDNIIHEATELPSPAATNPMTYVDTDVADVLSILGRASGAPAAIVSYIAYLGDVCSAYFVDTHDAVVGNAPLDREYLRLIIPAMTVTNLEVFSSMLVLECVSHDQGWASDQTDNQTYRNCWSWVEFEVVDATNAAVLVPRQVMCRNLRASKTYRRHRMQITDKSILRHLQPGCQVVLYLRARYNAWSNHARYASISLIQWWGARQD